MNPEIDQREVWNSELAHQLPGQTVLVGLSYFDTIGAPIEQQQLFGRVDSADSRNGILLSLEGAREGQTFALPPDTRSFEQAHPGEYRLRSTGEIVVNPDYTVTFSISGKSTA